MMSLQLCLPELVLNINALAMMQQKTNWQLMARIFAAYMTLLMLVDYSYMPGMLDAVLHGWHRIRKLWCFEKKVR